MEEGICHNGTFHIFCFRLQHRNHWAWISAVLPAALCFLVHLSSFLLDTILACGLAFNNQMFSTGLVTFLLIFLPAVVMMVFKPPVPPDRNDFGAFYSWILQVLVGLISSPLRVSVSLLNHLIWTANTVSTTESNDNSKDERVTKEIHTYLFLHAFLHCAPQAIIQMHLLILGAAKDGFTVSLQVASVLVSIVTVASCTTSLHRYEAQVEGGRPAVLLTQPPPQHDTENRKPLLPINFCLRNSIVSLEMDSPIGKVIAFISWFLLIFGRILCLVISYKTHQGALIFFVLVHFSLMLLYLSLSQSITLTEIPSRLFNVTISFIALVEVSIRFFKIPLLYTLFFICYFVEDVFLMVLFFVYPPALCHPNNLDCKYFGWCSYLIINSHVIGIIVFGIYLAGFRPRKKTITTCESTISIVSIENSYIK